MSEKSGEMNALWSWGASFSDLDGDGWEDLVVANGYLTRDDSKDL
jgi:hypothetical protein